MKLADQFAFWLVPVLIVVALGVFASMTIGGYSAAAALQRALAVLVVSCPCALSLAVPLVVSVSAAKAARTGILLRDASVLEDAGKLSLRKRGRGQITHSWPRFVCPKNKRIYRCANVLCRATRLRVKD